MTRRAVVARAVALASIVVVVAACAPTGSSEGTITVLAAASLTEPFTEIGRRFDGVVFSFDGSATLVQQVNNGAPADVLATADETTMQAAVDAGTVGAPAAFVRNRLAIVVAPGNPRLVRSLADLARPDLVVVLCAPAVPCGRSGQHALSRAGVAARPASLEPNVKGVVAKVALGEADAGIVYATDARAAADRATTVPIPADQNVVATYPIAIVRGSDRAARAEAFVAYVRSADGRAVLAAAGFEPV